MRTNGLFEELGLEDLTLRLRLVVESFPLREVEGVCSASSLRYRAATSASSDSEFRSRSEWAEEEDLGRADATRLSRLATLETPVRGTLGLEELVSRIALRFREIAGRS